MQNEDLLIADLKEAAKKLADISGVKMPEIEFRKMIGAAKEIPDKWERMSFYQGWLSCLLSLGIYQTS